MATIEETQKLILHYKKLPQQLTLMALLIIIGDVLDIIAHIAKEQNEPAHSN